MKLWDSLSRDQVCRLLANVVLASSVRTTRQQYIVVNGLITECSRVSQLSDDHYCRTLLHLVIDSQGFATTRKASQVARFVYLFWQIWQWYQIFDASKYVLGPCFLCCWSLVLFWALSVAFWWWFYIWTHLLQCIVVVQSFLRMLKLH